MNDIVNRMISTQLLLFIYMLCGVIIRRAEIIRNDNRQGVVRLLMDVAMPMMVLSAFNNPVTANEIRSSLWIMAIALAGCVVTGIIGRFAWRNQPESKRKVLMYGSMFSNAGNAGGVTAESAAAQGQPCSLRLTLPPLAVLVLEADDHDAG